MIFYSDGKALAIAGPSGVILAFVIVGVVTVCVMDCVSEFAQNFPIPNAVVSYVGIFVDRDWAWIVGIAYWYSKTMTDFRDIDIAAGIRTRQSSRRRSSRRQSTPSIGNWHKLTKVYSSMPSELRQCLQLTLLAYL